MKKFKAVAPSNIALIKYMGKTDASQNRPTNASLSYTLPHLKSLVEIETISGAHDIWEPLIEHEGKKLPAMKLSDKGVSRFLNHLGQIKTHFGYDGAFKVRSANDFPADCGLASSASSFAALTMAGFEALSTLTQKPTLSLKDVANWSRRGSGSSCRSFFAPWALWGGTELRSVPEIGNENLIHQVIVVNEDVKSVSSSEAHIRVSSSDLFIGRVARAEERILSLMEALKTDDWKQAFELTWSEFWDMHALFETSKPSFGYMTAGSLQVLRFVRSQSWDKVGVDSGPIVTMDAGPNVHLLYRPGRSSEILAAQIGAELSKQFLVISNMNANKKQESKS